LWLVGHGFAFLQATLPTETVMRYFLLLPLLLLSAPSAARDCRLNGESINPDNASYYAGKSGRIECYDEAGQLVSEEEVHDGEIVGYERRKDLWGNWSERTTNENGNTQGTAKEFWPDGTLKSEANYENGELVGASRSFHKNGKPARLSHSQGAMLEYDSEGQLKWLTCAPRPLLPEDRKPCGFDGEAATTLHLGGGRALRVTYRDGKLLAQEEIDASGAISATSALEDGAEVRRTFHPNGKPAGELRVVDGWHVEEREWYMNGQLKSHTVREPKERDPHVETSTWRDDGTQSTIETFSGRRLVTRRSFDKQGRLEQVEDYAPAGHLGRRRIYAPDGQVVGDEAFYPDGSRK
jgi:antitoxin component YwqK of YwqJK toxin-antitoxin module